MAQPGLLQWSNSILLSMANDSGRQLFQDQINTHGFLFLNDYLDNIVSGMKQDPLIELVKTPSRKKVFSKRLPIKGASSKLAHTTPFSNDATPGVENALRNNSNPTSQEQGGSSSVHIVQPPHAKPSPASVPVLDDLVHQHLEANQLSMIAEDDEMVERSGSMQSHAQSEDSRDVPSKQPDEHSKVAPQVHNNINSQPELSHTSVEVFSSSDIKASSSVFDAPEQDSPSDSTKQIEPEQEAGVMLPDSKPTAENFTITGSSFPSLPAPLPLRKSMRVPPESSSSSALAHHATPHTIPDKRTSWLKKAREVKAMEISNRRGQIDLSTEVVPSATLALAQTVHNKLKRKSDDMSTDPGSYKLDEPERLYKFLKPDEQAVMDKLEQHVHDDAEGVPKGGDLKPRVAPLANEHLVKPEGMLDRLKKTVEDIGARVGKSMGRSPGTGPAANALAEARAAAEARIAERNSEEVMTIANELGDSSETAEIAGKDLATKSEAPARQRLSLSDLVIQQSEPKSHSSAPKANQENTTAIPHSTPISHPPNRTLLTGPVFIPPTSTSSKPRSVASPPFQTKIFKVPSPGASLQYTTFDPPWLTSAHANCPIQSGTDSLNEHVNAIDEDDSWPLDEKIASGVPWTFGVDKEDSLTWSTLHSQSDTSPLASNPVIQNDATMANDHQAILGAEEMGAGPTECQIDRDNDQSDEDSTQDMADTGYYLGSSNLKSKGSESHVSLISSVSSQSQPGFFGQASKLISNALGTNKKSKPEVKKVLQMAAAAAKKQQEENDKKAARLKEMEHRRQLAMQRKAEEEKARLQEQERKMKEENERRKREREEITEKRTLKAPFNKKEEDNAKKRKITIDEEKKSEMKKPAPKSVAKMLKQPSALMSSAVYNASSTFATQSHSKMPGEQKLSVHKGKMKVAEVNDDGLAQPSQLLQNQMAARAEAQLHAAKLTEPIIPSESIELPDINSEYSDSEDEDKPRTFDPPDWAQSPELRHALQMQSTINPDEIFGAVRPLKMEEIFKTRTSRFRARTSSANWTGADRLTLEEEKEYARRMGFK